MAGFGVSLAPPREQESCEWRFGKSLEAMRIPLRHYARKLSGSMDGADDLVQDTMLRAWRARGSFVPGSNLKAWLFTILRNVFFAGRRRAKFHGDYNEVSAERLSAVDGNQEAAFILLELRERIKALPEEQRRALELVGLGGLTIEEAAATLGTPTGTVKSRVHRARAALRPLGSGNTAPVIASSTSTSNARLKWQLAKAAGRTLVIG